jgi:spermidine synthase
VLDSREGVLAASAVVDDAQGHRYLKTSNLFTEGGTARGFAERRQASVPLLLHADPRRVLILGVGTGITAGAAAEHPGVQVDAVELLPEVVALLPWFEEASGGLLKRQGATVRVADARRYVRSATQRYDVIVADLFHPARDGSGWLYTTEHFTAVRSCLAPRGLFCQWLPLHQLDEPMLRTIVRTFVAAFPYGAAFLAGYNADRPALGLVGAEEPLVLDLPWMERRVGRGPAYQVLVRQEQALYDDFALLGTFVADRTALARFAGPGPLNSDDRPLVRFGAPRLAYTDQHDPAGRLQLVLRECRSDPAALFKGADEPAAAGFIERLRRYLAARDAYLEGAILALRGDERGALERYLEAIAESRDLETAYQVCLLLARQRGASDAAWARALLERLQALRPDRREAADLLRQLLRRP